MSTVVDTTTVVGKEVEEKVVDEPKKMIVKKKKAGKKVKEVVEEDVVVTKEEEVKSYKDVAKTGIKEVKDDDVKSVSSIKTEKSWADQVEEENKGEGIKLPSMDELYRIKQDVISGNMDYEIMREAYDKFIEVIKEKINPESIKDAVKRNQDFVLLFEFDDKKRVLPNSDIRYIDVFLGTMNQRIHGEGATYDKTSRIPEALKKNWTLAYMNSPEFEGVFYKIQKLFVGKEYEARVYKSDTNRRRFELVFGEKRRIKYHEKCFFQFKHAWKLRDNYFVNNGGNYHHHGGNGNYHHRSNVGGGYHFSGGNYNGGGNYHERQIVIGRRYMK